MINVNGMQPTCGYFYYCRYFAVEPPFVIIYIRYGEWYNVTLKRQHISDSLTHWVFTEVKYIMCYSLTLVCTLAMLRIFFNFPRGIKSG